MVTLRLIATIMFIIIIIIAPKGHLGQLPSPIGHFCTCVFQITILIKFYEDYYFKIKSINMLLLDNLDASMHAPTKTIV